MLNIDPLVTGFYEGPEAGWLGQELDVGLLDILGHLLFTSKYGSIFLF